ncbi:MAG: polyprenyl synthetase family protein [Selenomonadaceae bacterium]|nr:polyprenyl synthetase family protein [Selenomonadaceae bacterium]
MDFVSVLKDVAIKDLQELGERVEQSVSEDKFIYDACAPLLSGGKRLRPVLFLLCARSRGICPNEKTMPLATALELIHTASLVHDDILDNAKKRRGVETINSRYGAQISVLVGDYLFAKAFQLVAENDYGNEVAAVLSKLVKNLCTGEIMQDRSLFTVPTMSEYYERINLKTAIFLSSCCRLGGIVAGLSQKEIDGLAFYGGSLGLAFQIVDDLLDFFGDEKITGKILGGDLKSGVVTLPVIRALQVSERAGVLREIITRGEISTSDISTAIEIIKSTDAVEYCKMRADGHIDSARINLPFLIKTSVGLALEQIADFVVDRSW